MLHQIEVVCYAGYRAGEKPLTFTYKNREFNIKKILDRSVEESFADRDTVYRFRVLCADGETFSLLFDPRADQWFLEER
jgi:hypothetical protein